jgi:hypothetical protein
MTQTFTIYSSNGFIGFCFIYTNGNFIQGGLSLFETVDMNGNTMMYQQSGKYDIYGTNLTNLDIIRDLMLKAIPSLRTNGLTYSATDNNGKTQII